MRSIQNFCSEGLKGRIHLEDLGVDCSIILTWNFIERTEHNGRSVWCSRFSRWCVSRLSSSVMWHCMKVKCTLVQALRLCAGRTAYRRSRGIALPFHDHGTRRGWGVSVTPRPLFTPGKDPVPIVQEAGWAPGPVWTGAENLATTGIRSPDRPARSQSLYRLRYPAPVALYSLVVISDVNSCKCCLFYVEMENNMPFHNVGKFVPDFMEVIPLCLLLIKHTTVVQSYTTQVYLIN